MNDTANLPASAATSADRMLSIIADAAQNPAVDVAKMKELLTLKRDLIHDQAVAEFNAAYGRLVVKLPRIKKDGAVEYPDDKGKKKKAFAYATYEAIDEIVRPLLLDEGFSLSFDSKPREGEASLSPAHCFTLLDMSGRLKYQSQSTLPAAKTISKEWAQRSAMASVTQQSCC